MTSDATSSTPTTLASVSTSPQVNATQEQLIHRGACAVVAAAIDGREAAQADDWAGAADQTVMGAFVTLRRHGRLRACCGTLGRPMPLGEAVRQAAERTATEDPRFPTISPTELPHLDADVTLLYGFQPLTARGRDRLAEIQIGRHGLHIRRGEQSGLLLPSVPVEWGWDAEQFLVQVCRKAGLPGTAWLDDATQLQKFEGHSISGEFPAELIGSRAVQPPALFSEAELRELAEECRRNLVALIRGATPNYYLPGCPDGTVQIASIAARAPHLDQPLQYSQMSLRPGVPLQATLFQLVEAAAKALQSRRLSPQETEGIGLELTVLFDPAMHGTVAEPDLDGVDPARRGLLVVERTRTAWVYDGQRAPRQLLDDAARAAGVISPESAAVFSLAVQSTGRQAALSNAPRPAAGGQTRPPAVAGMFYPRDAGELSQLVESMLDGDTAPQDHPAVMVPHAGLIYSGRLAAATFQRVRIPDTVIVIGPKHTRLGVEWAVAPHDSWSLPGGSVASDPQLARQLADAIPGLQLDAAAHQQEHAIEVELPFIARLAPAARVVGIAIGAADLDNCRRFASGLADVVRSLPQRPLLVISSDMNHFASDRENRRLDEIALRAIETLDPAEVYQTVVQQYNISMCGVRPCIVVMETLRQLGLLDRCQRLGYATSADISGDTTRVVGYAGMTFG